MWILQLLIKRTMTLDWLEHPYPYLYWKELIASKQLLPGTDTSDALINDMCQRVAQVNPEYVKVYLALVSRLLTYFRLSSIDYDYDGIDNIYPNIEEFIVNVINMMDFHERRKVIIFFTGTVVVSPNFSLDVKPKLLYHH